MFQTQWTLKNESSTQKAIANPHIFINALIGIVNLTLKTLFNINFLSIEMTLFPKWVSRPISIPVQSFSTFSKEYL
ncbi:MAG: hypothetical protein KME05_17180 [Gloeocapsa sp. UFS-A4-WI-NPMV-4B04]|nr:hypothetical protein [Gloeocapsa sp. UFS-A4-WI-NPMV-4B04]